MLKNADPGAGGAAWGAGAVGCHVPKGTAVPEPPDAESLSYSFTLPAGPHNARIARQVARDVLTAHGLEDLHDAGVQVVSEFAACAWRFTPTPEVYVCLRYRGEALRVIVYDGHPRHTNPRLAATCDGQRKAALRLAAAVVKACQGEWGFGDAREPGAGRGRGRCCRTSPRWRSGARNGSTGRPRGRPGGDGVRLGRGPGRPGSRPGAGRSLRRGRQEMFHKRMVLSSPALASTLPSGLNATAFTGATWPVRTSVLARRAMFHSLTEPS